MFLLNLFQDITKKKCLQHEIYLEKEKENSPFHSEIRKENCLSNTKNHPLPSALPYKQDNEILDGILATDKPSSAN